MQGRNGGRLLFGLIVLTVGVLFTLDNLGVLDSWEYLQWWPLIIVGAGAWRLVQARSTAAMIGGLVVTFLGVMLLDNTVNILPGRMWNYWPVLLILFGSSMMLRAWSGPGANVNTDASSKINAFALMSGVERKVTSQSFVGGDATAIMGGCDIDLRQAQIANGPAVIDVFAFWGGIDIFVPGDWVVRDETVAIMGAVTDSRKMVATERTFKAGVVFATVTTGVTKEDQDPNADVNRVLILRGGTLMGGVEIKN